MQLNFNPLDRHKAPTEVEGANIDQRLVPFHGKCKRLFIYLYVRYAVLLRWRGKVGYWVNI